ncbi:ribulose-phosphate 3-epimerase [Candidatus Bandiella euplotis]|nr:ribulose-phosphate 3-epimerase [Candidatus Bandiella woodruffii]
MKKSKVSASILAADFSKLGEEVELITQSGADSIHLDIMDGHFVPNISFGPDIVKCIRAKTHLPLKTHLMVSEPERYIGDFANVGSDLIIFHYEAVIHVDSLIERIKALGVKVGIAIVPSTPASVLQYIYHKLDEILVMTVNPGFGGQQFLESQLEKIKAIAEMTKGLDNIQIGVDGGINPQTVSLCQDSGADLAIVGSYLFQGNDYKSQVTSIREKMQKTFD